MSDNPHEPRIDWEARRLLFFETMQANTDAYMEWVRTNHPDAIKKMEEEYKRGLEQRALEQREAANDD